MSLDKSPDQSEKNNRLDTQDKCSGNYVYSKSLSS